MPKTIIAKEYIRIVRYIEIALVILLIPILYNFLPIDEKASETLFIDAKNENTLVQSLENNGYSVTFVDKFMMQLSQTPTTGWYTLSNKDVTRYTFFSELYKYEAKTMDIRVYAGETHIELIKRLANDIKLDRDILKTEYKIHSQFKEADIFAGHYRVARKADEKAVMLYLFNESQKILDLFIEKTFHNKPDKFEIKVLLTIASIIQKESNAIEEMSSISAVIYNRLNKNMRLQMDSTLNYGSYSHTIVTPERIKSDTSYYNTYKHKGLPPSPLGTISVNALQAAMFPEKNKDLFFMLKPDGKHIFCETYDTHLENIRTFRTYQKKREEEKEKLAKALEEAKKCRMDTNETNETNRSKSIKVVKSRLKELK